MDILREFGDRLVSGLSRAGVNSASKWAEMYRRTKDGGPWSHWTCPWAVEWLDARVDRAAILKAAQMRATETMLSKGMFCNDVLKRDVLYVLPNKVPDASDFSSARFDAAVVASPYLTSLYDRSNVGHKRTGVANFYIRGGQSRAGLKSVPVFMLVLDELDEMNQENIPLAYERTSGQMEKEIWELSTPTIEEHGIAKTYEDSTQEHFFFTCPSCSKWTELTYPECLVVVGDDPTSSITLRESHIICKECGNKLNHFAKREFLSKGRWVAGVEGREKRGFYINQLYSMTVTPGEVAAAVIRARMSEWDEQELYNSKLALPHTPKGAKVTQAQVDSAKGEHINGCRPRGDKIVTMGIDQGNMNYVEVCEWTLGDPVAGDVNVNAHPKVLLEKHCRDFEEFDVIMENFNVACAVIDAQPERRKAKEFADRHHGRVHMCIYGQGVNGKLLNVHRSDYGEPMVTVDRTSWMDQSLGRFKPKADGKPSITLPRDVSFMYQAQVQVPSRIWQRDATGNPIATWLTASGKADHFAHARNYAEIALPLACTAGQSYEIESPV